jgi:hypothetical protein
MFGNLNHGWEIGPVSGGEKLVSNTLQLRFDPPVDHSVAGVNHAATPRDSRVCNDTRIGTRGNPADQHLALLAQLRDILWIHADFHLGQSRCQLQDFANHVLRALRLSGQLRLQDPFADGQAQTDRRRFPRTQPPIALLRQPSGRLVNGRQHRLQPFLNELLGPGLDPALEFMLAQTQPGSKTGLPGFLLSPLAD